MVCPSWSRVQNGCRGLPDRIIRQLRLHTVAVLIYVSLEAMHR
jgi:hypothetical protein